MVKGLYITCKGGVLGHSTSKGKGKERLWAIEALYMRKCNKVDFGGLNNLQIGKSWFILGQRQKGKER